MRVAQENAPPGGWVQIKVYADTPALLSTGVLAIDLDPAVFGPVASVAAFSANGDAMGLARVEGTHVEAELHSLSGGVGQLPGIPVFVVRAPVLATASGTGRVTLSLPESPLNYRESYPNDAWQNPAGVSLPVQLVSGSFNVSSNALSVEDVMPGGGLQPAGTVLKITGTGFLPGTRVSAEGARFSEVKMVSPTLIEATLASAVEITGLKIHVEDAVQQLDFFPALPSAYKSLDPATQVSGRELHTIVPLREYNGFSAGTLGTHPQTVILQNPTNAPVDVHYYASGPSGLESGSTFTIPAASSRGFDVSGLSAVTGDSAVPLRVLGTYSYLGGFQFNSAGTSQSAGLTLAVRPSPSEVAWTYQLGSAPLPSRTVRMILPKGVQDVLLDGSADWITKTATRTQELTDVTFSLNPAGLAPGNYTQTFTIRPVAAIGFEALAIQTSTITITASVSASPTITVEPMYPASNTGFFQLSPIGLNISSNGSPANFTASVTTESGGNWLSINQSSGTTPAVISIAGNQGTLPGGSYDGTITIRGPINTETVRVTMRLFPLPPTPPQANPSAVTLIREVGDSGPFDSRYVSISPNPQPFIVQVRTEDGGNWLSAENRGGLYISASPGNLAPGTYRGTVTVVMGPEGIAIPVTFIVTAKPTQPPQVSPSSLTFVTPAGVRSAPQTLTVTTPQEAPLYTIFPNSVEVTSNASSTPNTYTAFASEPGTYLSKITVTNSAGSVDIPVSVHVTASPQLPPVIASVTNGASQRPGSLAPGEVITIRGSGVGPPTTGLAIDSAGKIVTRGPTNSKVLINGVEAPILYGSISQWNVVVPYEAAGKNSATVQVFAGDAASATWTLPVLPSTPGLFTQGSTGVGVGAVLNQDNTVNSRENPAPVGTVIQVFGTGAGTLNPAAATGSVSSGTGATSLRVQASIGAVDAPVVYAGPAPGLASGVIQVNAVVPRQNPPNGVLRVPLKIIVSGVESQSDVVVYVR